MAALDDLKTATAGLESQLAANKTLLDSIFAQLTALAAAGSINPADVEAVAQQITADTATLASTDTADTPPAPAGPTGP